MGVGMSLESACWLVSWSCGLFGCRAFCLDITYGAIMSKWFLHKYLNSISATAFKLHYYVHTYKTEFANVLEVSKSKVKLTVAWNVKHWLLSQNWHVFVNVPRGPRSVRVFTFSDSSRSSLDIVLEYFMLQCHFNWKLYLSKNNMA